MPSSKSARPGSTAEAIRQKTQPFVGGIAAREGGVHPGQARQCVVARAATAKGSRRSRDHFESGVLERFDHRFLNELEPFSAGINPTAENLARIIFEELAGNDAFVRDSELFAITVYETPTSSVTYTRD